MCLLIFFIICIRTPSYDVWPGLSCVHLFHPQRIVTLNKILKKFRNGWEIQNGRNKHFDQTQLLYPVSSLDVYH